jgi:predicted metal-dependent HD superfamily phosphohydrolase
MISHFTEDKNIIPKILKDYDLVSLVNKCYEGRYYHNINHVIKVIYNIDEILENSKFEVCEKEKHILYMAAIFHDLIQGNGNDVEISANLAKILFSRMNLYSQNETEMYSVILYKIIMSTKHHKPRDFLSEVFCDADMMILASDEKEYKKYKKSIRKEYKHINYFMFMYGRKKFLVSLLFREIFHTKYCQSLEKKARKNIIKEIFSL